MFFCGTCGTMVRSETNICPKCLGTLSPTYMSSAGETTAATAWKQTSNNEPSVWSTLLDTVSTMNRAKKVLLIGGIVLSLVPIATAVAYTVAMRPGRSVYLLPDGNVMAYVNFTPMHFMNMDTSPFTSDPEYQRFVNETGLHADRDLDNIAISANTDGGPSGDVAIIVTGTFDQQRLSSYMQKQEGVQTETYGGKTIFSVPEKDQ